MSDYISREDIREEILLDRGSEFARGWNNALFSVYNHAPRADVRENIHGEWENCNEDNPDNMIFRCSVCGYAGMTEYYNFCPNCGADMGVKNDK